MPRELTPAEVALLALEDTDERLRVMSSSNTIAVPITNSNGDLIASLSLFTENTPSADALYPLARIVSMELSKDERSGDFYQATLEGLRDPVFVVRSDLTIGWTSTGTTSLFGLTPTELIGQSVADFIHHDDLEIALNAIIRISQGLAVTRVTLRVRNSEDVYLPIEVTGMDHTTNPLIDGIVMSLRDAQGDDELAEQVDTARRFSRAIIDSLRDGIVATDKFGTVIVANEIARSMFSIDPQTHPANLSIDDFTLMTADGTAYTPTDARGESESICPVVTSDGQLMYVTPTQHQVEAEDEGAMGTVMVFHDVTEEQRAAEELRTQALHDQLTGLANRRQLEQRLHELTHAAQQVPVAACFIDLDNFKLINDNHGHRTGDQLVRLAAQRLVRQLGENDLLVRQGGDEFVALLVDVDDLAEAQAVADRCRIALAHPYEFGDDRFDVTASIGVAIAAPDKLLGDELLQQADIALYAAKNRGRNRVELFDSALAEAVSNEDRQRRILREALDEGRLTMHFQPLVMADTEQTTGYEALARIRTREGELIGPGQFIEAISNTGLMWDLDRAAFLQSCQAAEMLARINPEAPPHIACNFSSVSLTHPKFVGFVCDTVETTGVNPAQITIEITESAAFDAGVDSLTTLNELNQLGFRLSLDDFGTGYSSLAHLRDLPISTVKVDRSFITKLGNNDSERAIAEAVVSLANDLHLSVVAEGVETEEHLSHVRTLGFGVVQGWHYAPALSLSDCLQDWTDISSDDVESSPTRPSGTGSN